MKNVILFLFMLLPRKIYMVYTSLCFYTFVYIVRHRQITTDQVNIDLLSKIMHVTINKDTVLLPIATYRYLWTDTIVNETIKIDSTEQKLGDMIKEGRYSEDKRQIISEIFIDKLPAMIKYKLDLKKNSVLRQRLETIFSNILVAA